MKKFLIVLFVLIAAPSLGGCAGLQTAFNFATTPVTVTPTMVYEIENGLKAATAGLVGYRRLCIKKVIDPVTRTCRKVIATVQTYTRAAAVAIVDLRTSVRANDQVTAISTYKSLRELISNIQIERQKAGVR